MGEKNKKSGNTEELSLKWGTLKGWSFTEGGKAHELMKKYAALGMSMGCAQQKDTPEQKKLICQIIEAVDCDKIHLDWDGKFVTKKKAQKYVMEYS